MQTPDDVIAACRTWKEMGSSPKMPVYLTLLEKIARQAKAYEELPTYIKEVAEAVRAGK